MSVIASVFKPGYKALIAYITAGYPDPKATVKIATTLAESGCDIIELGIPFSDPLADGATIQKASYQSLKKGVTPEMCLDIATEIRKNIETPLIFMTYYNPVLNYGLNAFCKQCVKAGINGLIVPDLPPEEGLELETITRKNDLDLIYLLAPTSTENRINIVASSSRGFIYLVSLTGVTGARDTLAPELADFVGAREQYRMSLELDPQPRVQRKLDTVFASAASSSSARLQIRYDGASDQPLGLAVLRVLDLAWAEYEKRLGFAPAQAVTVVLETATSFRDTTRAPEWAAAWNDGTIRVPVAGLQAPTPGLVRVLRHELAHSFVASRAGASCPTWLHEGIAQWLEGRDAQREDAELAKLAARKPLPRLESLESPFVRLTEAQATTAYAESLSAVAHIVRRRGERGLRRLIDALADGHPAAEALPVALAVSYGELQRDWETHLRAGIRGAGL